MGLLRLRQTRVRAGRAYGQVAIFKRDWASACARGFVNFLPNYGSSVRLGSKYFATRAR